MQEIARIYVHKITPKAFGIKWKMSIFNKLR